MDEVLHGREVPLRALRDALDGALRGRGRCVLITGDAGLGKSSLANAIAVAAEGRATVMWGRAWEFADAPPYFPVRSGLRTLGITATDGPSFELWESTLVALAALDQPVVWVVEDLHAADLGTLDLLTFLAMPVRSLRVLLVATTRAVDPRLTERKQQRLTRMARDGSAIQLEPVSDRDVAAIAEGVLGRPLSAAMLGKLADLTGGNPLFIVECARALRQSDALETLPPTIRQAIEERVELLPAATRSALAAGAVLGRDFSAATCGRLIDALPARVIDQLLPALRSGVIRELRLGQFQFSHTLVRDAIEAMLPDDDRGRLHGRAAAALASQGDRADVLVDRARHALAAAGHLPARDVLELIAHAVALLERERAHDRAFELAMRVEDARTLGALPPATIDERLKVATLARAAARSDVTRRICEEVMAVARADGDGSNFARAILLHAADIRVGVVDHKHIALLEEARALLGDRDPSLACRVLARLATALIPHDDVEVPIALAREARRRALELGDAATTLDVLELAVWAFYNAGGDRAVWIEQWLDHARQSGDRTRHLEALLWSASLHLEDGAFAAFDRDVTLALTLSDEIGHPRHRWRPLLLASGRAIAYGRFAESERLVAEAAQLAGLADDPSFEFSLVAHQLSRARHMRRDGLVASVSERLDHAMRDLRNPELFGSVMCAQCAARREDVAATREHLAMIDGLPLEHLDAELAEAIALAGTDTDRRRLRARLAVDQRSEFAGGHITFAHEGSLDRARGLLDASLGDLEAAVASLRRAHASAIERGLVSWVAQIGYELASVLRRLGRAAEAQPIADDSQRIAIELGMTGLAGSVAEVAKPALVITRDGDVWTISRGDTIVRLRDSRGIQLLSRLVERPGEEIHVLALASDEATSAPASSSGEHLDKRAIAAYRKRLAELEEIVERAEAAGDAKRATAAERETVALRAELARALGIGGRSREAGATTERARINVQRRLKDAIAQVTRQDAGLGTFLDGAVRTGTYCCFQP